MRSTNSPRITQAHVAVIVHSAVAVTASGRSTMYLQTLVMIC